MASGQTPTASTLPRTRSSRLQLRPWTPFEDPVRGGNWGTLDFRSIRVEYYMVITPFVQFLQECGDTICNGQTECYCEACHRGREGNDRFQAGPGTVSSTTFLTAASSRAKCRCVNPPDQGDFRSELTTKFGVFHAGTADVAYPETVDAGIDQRRQERR